MAGEIDRPHAGEGGNDVGDARFPSFSGKGLTRFGAERFLLRVDHADFP